MRGMHASPRCFLWTGCTILVPCVPGRGLWMPVLQYMHSQHLPDPHALLRPAPSLISICSCTGCRCPGDQTWPPLSAGTTATDTAVHRPLRLLHARMLPSTLAGRNDQRILQDGHSDLQRMELISRQVLDQSCCSTRKGSMTSTLYYPGPPGSLTLSGNHLCLKYLSHCRPPAPITRLVIVSLLVSPLVPSRPHMIYDTFIGKLPFNCQTI
jgi:hypothetical protein